MEEKLDKIAEDIFEMKLDLREHMRRTEVNESQLNEYRRQLEPMWKAYIGAKWSVGAIVTVLTILSMWFKLK